MTRDQFIYYPALSCSRIKKHYTGDISYAKVALELGVSLHHQLLDLKPEQMNLEAYNVHKAISNHPVAKRIMDGAINEHPMIKEVQVGRHTIQGKAMFDIYNQQLNVIADIKTTSAKTLDVFGQDMTKHYNHIQAVWYSLIAGIDPKNFYYIGVTARSKRSGSTSDSILVYRHNDHEIADAYKLITGYLDININELKSHFNSSYKS
jgi:hypothetical protein